MYLLIFLKNVNLKGSTQWTFSFIPNNNSLLITFFQSLFLAVTIAISMLTMTSYVQAEIVFEETSESAGIVHIGQTWGISWGEVNGDGWPDIWVSNHLTKPNLYLNNKNGGFSNIINDVWEGYEVADTHGAAWVDFDNDGDQDLIELSGGALGSGTESDPSIFNHLYVNKNGILDDEAEQRGVLYPLGRGRTPLWFDWNSDGQLDIALFGFLRPDDGGRSLLLQQNNGVFIDVTQVSGFEKWAYSKTGLLSDVTDDGYLDILIHNGGTFPAQVYEGGNMPLTDVRKAVAIPKTFDVSDIVISDLNGDLRPDFFIVRSRSPYDSDAVQIDENNISAFLNGNDFGITFVSQGNITVKALLNIKGTGQALLAEPNNVFIGAQGFHPTEVPFVLSTIDSSVWGFPSYNANTDAGIYIGYDNQINEWKLRFVKKGKILNLTISIESSNLVTNLVTEGFSSNAFGLRDTVLINVDTRYKDVTSIAGLDKTTSCLSTAAGDFDNDMDVDLYLVCSRPAVNLPNILYENLGDGTFTEVPNAGGAVGSTRGRGESIAIADYDQDGFLDLFVTNGQWVSFYHNGPHQLFHNKGNDNHWLEVDLEGVVSNRDGIGAKIYATVRGTTQLRELNGGIHRYSQNHQRIHFGLGNYTMVDLLKIHWPNGIVQELKDIPSDQLLHIVEPVEPSPVGKPVYQVGIDEGVYLWKDTLDGPYHLRVSGAGTRTNYQVRLVSSEALIEATPFNIEGQDLWQNSSYGFSLSSYVSIGQDGVDFQVPLNAKLLLSVEKEGAPNLRQSHVGASGKPLSPVGWIKSSQDLPRRPDHQEDGHWGLFVGQGGPPDVIEARWQSDAQQHNVQLNLIAAEPFISTNPVSLEQFDKLTKTANSISIDGEIMNWWFDGIDLVLSQPGDVGITYKQDQLFPPHRVNPNIGSLGLPNAGRLP